jgi:hypothetical protein
VEYQGLYKFLARPWDGPNAYLAAIERNLAKVAVIEQAAG